MSGQSLPELMQEVSDLSRCYSEWATRLSNRIQEFEATLNGLEGKIEAAVKHGQTILTFRRLNDKWCLLWQPSSATPPQPLISAPVTAKIEAVPLFPELLGEMVAHHRARRESLLQAVKAVEALLGHTGKEEARITPPLPPRPRSRFVGKEA